MIGARPPLDFSGRQGAALVLGGSGGLGAAITRLLAERGSAVAFTHRHDSPRVTELLALPANPPPRAYRLDLCDAVACAATAEAVAGDFGGIHTLVYAAGPHVPMVHLSMLPPEQFSARCTATRSRSSTRCSRACRTCARPAAASSR